MSSSPTVVILGSGMAGCGAAHSLHAAGVPTTLFDQHRYPGGHTATFVDPSGFIFDDGPHISFTKNQRLQALLAENVGGQFQVIEAYVNNYWRGHWIKHPAPCNLHGLPPDLLVKILSDFIAATGTTPPPDGNYADWLVATYGRTFAETFPMEYGHKYHTTPAHNMSTVWLGPRLYRPSLEEVLRGALTPQTPQVHYVSDFRYPTRDGFVAYLKPFFAKTAMHLGEKLVRIDPRNRVLTFASGRRHGYDHVISSIPLPELVPMIEGVPADVLAAARQLACTTCVTVNLGVDRADLSPAHWTYFYDREVFFTRLSFPHLLSPNNVPPGCGSIQAEVYYSKKYRPLDRAPADCIEPVVADLRRCGLLRESDRILFQEARVIPYANIIFDLDRESALPVVHGYLDDLGIGYCGRYGEWGYQWTDEAFLSGEKAAEKVLRGTSTGYARTGTDS